MSGAPDPAPTGASPAAPPPNDAIGGEVSIGRGAAPPFLRWFNYGVFVAAIAYLVVFWPDTGFHWTAPFFAVLMAGWLAFIVLKKRPPEP
ncbi:MAG: hypothetical protein AAB289_07785 [Chloroflexota bacterium]